MHLLKNTKNMKKVKVRPNLIDYMGRLRSGKPVAQGPPWMPLIKLLDGGEKKKNKKTGTHTTAQQSFTTGIQDKMLTVS